MSEIMKKWNEKWKVNRLQMLFTELGEKERKFFENLELLTVKQTEYMNEYDDEGYRFNCIIQVLHEGNYYYIGEEYGSFYICDEEYMNSPQHWATFFTLEKSPNETFGETIQKQGSYNKKINEFLKEFSFETIADEIEEDVSAKQVELDSKTHVGMKSIGVEYNKTDGQYYVLFDNGMKIPYKKEKRHVTELYY